MEKLPINNISKEETKENILSLYVYRDNSSGAKIIFQCEANGILEADRMYQESTGKDTSKQSYIGCSIEKIEKSK